MNREQSLIFSSVTTSTTGAQKLASQPQKNLLQLNIRAETTVCGKRFQTKLIVITRSHGSVIMIIFTINAPELSTK